MSTEQKGRDKLINNNLMKILIIDDEPGIHKTLEFAFQNDLSKVDKEYDEIGESIRGQ